MRGIITKAVKSNRARRGVAAVVGLIACSGVVWQSSHATFTATTSNDGNTLGAGTVAIADNDGGSTAMFTPSAMAPGATGTVCMAVTYTGSLTPTAIKMYFPITGTNKAQESAAGAAYVDWADSAASEMDDYTTLQIEVNSADLATDPGYGNCAPSGVGTFSNVTAATSLRTLIKNNQNYAGTTLSAPTIGQNQWRVFRFTYALPSTAPDSVQGDGVKFGVTWEAQR
ncbi:hypothetical protein KOI35_22760 [Actinoplanes bogorensis]|uniref:Camelysin metallo-endopeptidase n=1 Tax=Paractinoplanes bogorensis TaxID=1610840 RepID=A0ABS5YSB4_9ACTN|nr:hypothetical protein [Actinoplanes bogorensis]MBU2666328.1 hypothetical protein [Actinoplanes bogorensis]